MASGSRSRKRPRKGTRRVDAAIDAMKLFGFPEKVVVKTVNELLKVYGVEGWFFIEEHAYAVLIEALLEKQSDADQENNNSVEKSSKGDGAGTLVARELSMISSPPTSDMEDTNAALSKKKIPLVENSISNDMEKLVAGVSSAIGSQTQHEISPLLLKNDSLDSAPQKNEPDATDVNLPEGQEKPARKHKPCYGWIDDDEEEDQEFVELTPVPLPDDIAKLLEGIHGK